MNNLNDINSGTDVRVADTEDKTITIKCSILYWFVLYKAEAIFLPLLCGITYMLPEGSRSYPIGIIFILVVLLKGTWGVIKILCMKWEITEEEMLVTRGVFSKCTDHTELYRVCDYQSSRNIVELLFGFWTYKITTTDTNMRDIYIFGIHKNEPLIIEIRRRVEEQKRKRHIYEIANH